MEKSQKWIEERDSNHRLWNAANSPAPQWSENTNFMQQLSKLSKNLHLLLLYKFKLIWTYFKTYLYKKWIVKTYPFIS